MPNYEGPGKYRHYGGGTYDAIGVGEHETTGALLVIYTSDSLEHTVARADRGAGYILRPLNAGDGPSAWNDDVGGVPRFRKIEDEGMATSELQWWRGLPRKRKPRV